MKFNKITTIFLNVIIKIKNFCSNLTNQTPILFLFITQFFVFSYSMEAYADAVQPASKIVILVPGFFNSFAPEYFSNDIILSLQKNNLKVIVAERLNPIGTIEENGEIVYKLFEKTKKQFNQSEINVIAHSAGGLYSLYAINKGAYYIKNLITVSTPYNGIEFVENWKDRFHLFSDLMKWCYLQGLQELTRPYVNIFLQSIRVPSSLNIYSYGGFQPVKLDFTNASNMSLVLSVTDAFMTSKSDGIVTFSSAIASTQIKTLEKTIKEIFPDPKFYLPLEHWEQVLDHKNFVLLGVRNTELIQQRQIQFYSGIGRMISKF